MRRLAALILVVLSIGCTRAPDAPPASTIAPASFEDAPIVLAASAAPVAHIPVALDVADRWVKPEDTVNANATARASSFEWYVVSRNPLSKVADEGPIALDHGRATTLDARRVGRHVFGIEEAPARLNVSILDGAIPLRLEARVVDDGAGVRFAPDELVGGRGSVVTVTNDLASVATLHRIDEQRAIGASGASIRFKLTSLVPELGDYDLVVVARDGAGAVGEANARLIFDDRKPDPDPTFGPFEGGFQLPPTPASDDTARYDFQSPFLLRSLDVRFNDTSALPAPAAVRLRLVGPAGSTLGSADASGFHVSDLPAGSYSLVVEHTAGALVRYAVEANGVWRLEPPASFFKD